MARVTEIALGRRHQVATYRFARRTLHARRATEAAHGGLILADGVGQGKTYEALATVATLLAQGLHSRTNQRWSQFHVMVLVPPSLVTKWSDELRSRDRFPRYLESWTSPVTRPVRATFEDVVVLRHLGDLRDNPGRRHRGHDQLPPGLYVVNQNLLWRSERKAGQLHATPWDAVIVDEAHHIAEHLVADGERNVLLARPKTATLLLTATPFQLTPKDMRGVLRATFGGYGAPWNWRKAEAGEVSIYKDEGFQAYREALLSHFKEGTTSEGRDALKEAARLRGSVSEMLRRRIVRNPRQDQRQYHLVDAAGGATPIQGDLFAMDDQALSRTLESARLIELGAESEQAYLQVRASLADHCQAGQKPFIAGAMRQLLSSYGQFRRSAAGRLVGLPLPADERHPKLGAAEALVTRLLAADRGQAVERGYLEKVLVFTTFVGSDARDESLVSDDHGTASTLKRRLERAVEGLFPRPTRRRQRAVRDALVAALEAAGGALAAQERSRVRTLLGRFAGSRAASLLLSTPAAVHAECGHLRDMLSEVETVSPDDAPPDLGPEGKAEDAEEAAVRRAAKRQDHLGRLLDRYRSRDLVARYDGAISQEQRDSHLRGFNSPFGPFVIIASSVGQEGIDLQRYCRSVIHYDLEWNPARIEQREGRVDRHGRLAKGAIDVYLLVCKDTYDERILYAMVNRSRWHRVLLARRKKLLEGDPSGAGEQRISAAAVRSVELDLRPKE